MDAQDPRQTSEEQVGESAEVAPRPAPEDSDEDLDFGHPRGTLAVVLLYAALFALGWVLLYVGVFLERGTPGP